MARFVLADDGICFDGSSPSHGPLGGVESSIVNLTKELAKLGHEVLVFNRCNKPVVIDGVTWEPISNGLPDFADVYIANRSDKLISLMPQAGCTVFWIHNPARYLLKWRYLNKLWRQNPTIIFIGDYHSQTYPKWGPGGQRITIPYGIAEEFTSVPSAEIAPQPRAIFTSNPLRSLRWLLEVWQAKIQPNVPDAELHLFSGAVTYGSIGDKKRALMADVLKYAETLNEKGVRVRQPLSKIGLVEELQKARVMLYRGDENETFCLALGEAQAAGVPAVVQGIGSAVERVRHGVTGLIENTENGFAEAAIKLLSRDDYWFEMHSNSQRLQRSWGWSHAAKAFERLQN